VQLAETIAEVLASALGPEAFAPGSATATTLTEGFQIASLLEKLLSIEVGVTSSG